MKPVRAVRQALGDGHRADTVLPVDAQLVLGEACCRADKVVGVDAVRHSAAISSKIACFSARSRMILSALMRGSPSHRPG